MEENKEQEIKEDNANVQDVSASTNQSDTLAEKEKLLKLLEESNNQINNQGKVIDEYLKKNTTINQTVVAEKKEDVKAVEEKAEEVVSEKPDNKEVKEKVEVESNDKKDSGVLSKLAGAIFNLSKSSNKDELQEVKSKTISNITKEPLQANNNLDNIKNEDFKKKIEEADIRIEEQIKLRNQLILERQKKNKDVLNLNIKNFNTGQDKEVTKKEVVYKPVLSIYNNNAFKKK